MSVDYKVYLFELDEVLYPKKDYMLQVYYLFANFIEYSEGRPIAKEVLTYMKDFYKKHGEKAIYESFAARFECKTNYKENLERLYANAQLPLKLELNKSFILYATNLIEKKKKVGILTAGNPVEQLNKLRQIRWNGLDMFFKVYFKDELIFRSLDPYAYIAEEFEVKKNEIKHILTLPSHLI